MHLGLAVSTFALAIVAGASVSGANERPGGASPERIFVEQAGVVAGEAEDFHAQTRDDVRAWHRVSSAQTPAVTPDPDPSHAADASGGAYVECLPDTRQDHADPFLPGENFAGDPGAMAVLSYRIYFHTPGRYYVWLRTFSTGTEDNGVHAGLNGTWPESGQRWQTTHKQAWHWDCRQRTAEVHVGVPLQLFLEVPTAGDHTLQLSMREDGTEIDKWVLARDVDFRPTGTGPDVHVLPAHPSVP